MKLQLTILFGVLFVLFSNLLIAQNIEYISPMPGSAYNSCKTNIILGSSELIDMNVLNENILTIIGDKSGKHDGKFFLSDNGKTIVFNPDKPFEPSEEVTVFLNNEIQTITGNSIEIPDFKFRTTPLKEPVKVSLNEREELVFSENIKDKNDGLLGDTLPADLIPVDIKTFNKPDTGYILMASWAPAKPLSYNPYLMILSDSGKVIKYQKLDKSGMDFKIHPNGLYSINKGNKAYILDKDLNILDSVTCQNGYSLDGHDFHILPNGHYVVMSYDPQFVDMSLVTPGGNPNTRVTGSIIQELDKNKNVVFQWRSWDHFKITDTYQNVKATSIDAVHLNSIYYDADGNIIISSRHLSEITKINRTTGEIIWRLGGKNNQFKFIDEHDTNAPTYFSYQHFARRLPNGNLTLFDNGNQHDPNYSRAVEYKLDEVKKEAQLVWEFRRTPDYYSSFMGSAQRLENGNTFICWGGGSDSGTALITEVHPDSTIAFELFVPLNYSSYRAYKYQLPACPRVANVNQIDVQEGVTYPYTAAGLEVKFNSMVSDFYSNLRVERFDCPPVNPVFDTVPKIVMPYRLVLSGQFISYNGEFHIDITKFPAMTMPDSAFAYYSDTAGVFHRLTTTYNKAKKILVFSYTALGQIIFGIPISLNLPAKPVLVLPANNSILNVKNKSKFIWSNIGDFVSNEIRIATDDKFANIVLDTNINSSDFMNLLPALPNKTYYWSVRSKNLKGYGEWSDTWIFNIADPFIKIVTPNGGETFVKDSTRYLLRWNHNLTDTVRVQLFRNGQLSAIIRDKLYSPYGGYLWMIPDSIAYDTKYTIKVSSIIDTNLFAVSDSDFTIKAPGAGVEPNGISIKSGLSLYQNYPNPFTSSTIIEFDLIQQGYTSVKIFTNSGEEIEELISGIMEPGRYRLDWHPINLASGMYSCKLSSGTQTQLINMIFIK